MSIVVADNSPLDVLLRLGHAQLLPLLFGRVIIPSQVEQELLSPHTPDITRQLILTPPEWLEIQTPSYVETIPRLHAGEEAAISLALELKADLLLIDDERGRREATKRGLAITGVIGILESSARRGWLNLRQTFARLEYETDFRIDPQILAARLEIVERDMDQSHEGG